MSSTLRPLAVVTGASSGIGLHLARLCGENGFDLVIAADQKVAEAVPVLQATGAAVESLTVDLGTRQGVDGLLATIGNRKVDALLANAGHGLGHAFLDQNFDEVRSVIDTNITGTLYLLHRVARTMVASGNGRILVTGSIAGFMPGSFQAVYNGSKAFVDSFAAALRNELKDSGVTVTCLMPGPTDTDFFDRANMLDTKVGAGKKDDPADVAKVGFDAMMAGDGDVVAGFKNKVQAALANVTPANLLATAHRKMAEPGTAK